MPADLPSDRNGLLKVLRGVHPLHWLHVGERKANDVVHHEVRIRTSAVHVYLDPTHRAVAVVTLDARRDDTRADESRAVDQKKYEALVAKKLKRFKLA